MNMKNKEKYIHTLIRYACADNLSFGVAQGHTMFDCYGDNQNGCDGCLFNTFDNRCSESRKQWLEEEYCPPFYLSREEKTLLDMLDSRWVVMARNRDNNLCLYDLQDAYRLGKVMGVWKNINNGTDCYCGVLSYIIGDSYFQMVKWEDDSPWLISDLKKLKVTED